MSNWRTSCAVIADSSESAEWAVGSAAADGQRTGLDWATVIRVAQWCRCTIVVLPVQRHRHPSAQVAPLELALHCMASFAGGCSHEPDRKGNEKERKKKNSDHCRK